MFYSNVKLIATPLLNIFIIFPVHGLVEFESGINSLLLEVVEKGEVEKVVEGRTYESGRRVEFELR